jgi:hypothetical protein
MTIAQRYEKTPDDYKGHLEGKPSIVYLDANGVTVCGVLTAEVNAMLNKRDKKSKT